MRLLIIFFGIVFMLLIANGGTLSIHIGPEFGYKAMAFIRVAGMIVAALMLMLLVHGLWKLYELHNTKIDPADMNVHKGGGRVYLKNRDTQPSTSEYDSERERHQRFLNMIRKENAPNGSAITSGPKRRSQTQKGRIS